MPPKLGPPHRRRWCRRPGLVEDVYPGDVAQDWVARHLDNPVRSNAKSRGRGDESQKRRRCLQKGVKQEWVKKRRRSRA
jgi:hypothetical protein